MAHLFQVGAGSGGMPVLDMVCRDQRIQAVTLVEPDIYKPHNVERHLFPSSGVGELKAELAERWLRERRPDLEVRILVCDLRDPSQEEAIRQAVVSCDLAVCAADNEPTKFHFDALMRTHGRPWTLGEVLSGGIGGFVHWFVPGGPCYGCVAGHLQRSVEVEKPVTPDYSQPAGPIEEATIPASMASIHVIASLHAHLTLSLLEGSASTDDLGFTSLLLPLQRVPGIFEEPFRPYRFRIPRSQGCLICQAEQGPVSAEDLDVALDQALARLGDT